VVKENQQKISKNSSLLNNIDKSNKHLYIDFTTDKIDLKIIKALMENPNIKSSELSEKLQVPLSTIQRRKTRIEESILKKSYYFNFSKMGYRTAEIFLVVDKGKVFETGEQILKLFDNNVVKATARINTGSNLCIEIVFKESHELYDILEKVKSFDHTISVNFSEVVNTIGDNTKNIIIDLLK
jgi:DNA-binding Lrp family transcriptional regulator